MHAGENKVFSARKNELVVAHVPIAFRRQERPKIFSARHKQLVCSMYSLVSSAKKGSNI
jgi:hypothetical protein